MNTTNSTLMATTSTESTVSVYRQYAITDKLLNTIPEWKSEATTLINEKNWKELVVLCIKWTTEEPNNADAHGNLGLSYTKLGQYRQAVRCFHQALALNPEYSKAMYTMGIAYFNLECFNEAIEAYHQALRIKPDYCQAWNNLAITYSLSGNKNAAMNTVEELRQLDPDQANELLQFISNAC
jgi:tetratricopeptide (TPR) repeat protein